MIFFYSFSIPNPLFTLCLFYILFYWFCMIKYFIMSVFISKFIRYNYRLKEYIEIRELQKHNGIHFSIWACHPSRRGHANLLCIVPILTDVPEGTIFLVSISLYTQTNFNFHIMGLQSKNDSSLDFSNY